MIRHSTRFSVFILIVVSLLFTAGFTFSKIKVKPDAFGKEKRFAIVSVVTMNKIRANSQTSGLIGMMKSATKKYAFSADAAPVIKKAMPTIYRELSKSKQFTLVSPRKVLASLPMKKVKGTKPKNIMGAKYIMPAGYKYIKSKTELKNLANDLKVDGVITMSVNYGVAQSHIGVAGIGVGKNYPTVLIAIAAMDRKGRLIWRHMEHADSKEMKFQLGVGPADFKKMEPYYMQLTRTVIRKHLKKLDSKL